MDKISVSSKGSSAKVSLSEDSSNYYAYLAKQWAVAENKIDNIDYSAKYYAEQAVCSLNSAVSDLRSEMSEQVAAAQNSALLAEQKAQQVVSANEVFQDDIDDINASLSLKADNESVTSALNNKAQKDLSNCTKPYVKTTYSSGASWYRIWSDGWLEQGGINSVGADATGTISFLKTFANTNYQCLLTLLANNTSMNGSSVGPVWVVSKTVNNFKWANDTWEGKLQWTVMGYMK